MPQLEIDLWFGQIVWLALTFGLLYAILARWALPRIGGAIERRKDRVAADLDEAERADEKRSLAERERESALSAARVAANDAARTFRSEMRERLASRGEALERELSSRRDAVEAEIASEAESARRALGGAASEIAESIVERLAGVRS